MDLKLLINEILKNENKEQVLELKDELKLIDDLKFDSIMLAELTVRIEDETGIDVFEDGIVITVGEILKKLDR